MGDKSNIEWTDATWNPIAGCSIVSPACTNCYAMAQAARIERMVNGSHYAGLTKIINGKAVWTGEVHQAPEAKLLEPLRWKRTRRIFVNSMSDLFHEAVPDEWIDRIFAVMALAPQHQFQVLTKRPERMRAYCSDARTRYRIARYVVDFLIAKQVEVGENWPVESEGDIDLPDDIKLRSWPLSNVWLGVTAEDQKRADERIPDLLATPAAVRFVSIEPMLGAVNLRRVRIATGHHTIIDALGGYALERGGRTSLDWVICGGESGPSARPMHPEWARSLRIQCGRAGVPFFFKQRGEWTWPEDPMSPDVGKDVAPLPDHPDDWREKEGAVRCMRVDGSFCDGYAGGSEEFIYRVGKKRAGRLLDGVEHNDFPKARD